jgi:serine/threonine protein kinase
MLSADSTILQEIFAELAELPVSERRARLLEINSTNKDLATELREMLAFHDKADGLLDEPLPIPAEIGTDDEEFRIDHYLGGQYEFREKLGSGGQGTVYKIYDRLSGRVEVLKVLNASRATYQADRDRFVREVKVLAELETPQIPTVYECGFDDSRSAYWMRMQYMEGETLAERLSQQPHSWEEAVRIAIEVARALETAHGKNIIHRDIKPANIMILTKGDAIKVLDFGLAKVVDGLKLTKSIGKGIGTHGYMSPEQQRSAKDIDHRTDIWSLGVVLLEMIIGRIPTSHECAVLPNLPNNAPRGLAHIIERSLQGDKNLRYGTVIEFKEALRELIASVSTVNKPSVLANPLILFAPTTITAMPVESKTIKPFWPLDLGKAWALDRGSFVGFAVNPHSVDIAGEFRGMEGLLRDALTEIDTPLLPRRIWLRVRPDILSGTNIEIKHLNDLLFDDDRRLLQSPGEVSAPSCTGFVFTIDDSFKPSLASSIVGKLCQFVLSFCVSRGWQTAIVFDLRLQNIEARQSLQSIVTESVESWNGDYETSPRIETVLIDRYAGTGLHSPTDGANFSLWFRELVEIAGYKKVLGRFREVLSVSLQPVIDKIMECDQEAETELFSAAASLNDNVFLSNPLAVATFLQLINDNLRRRLDEVIEAFARSSRFELSREAIIVAAASDRLMDRWIAGAVAGGSELDIKRIIAPGPEESLREPFVLACLRRYSSNRDRQLLKKWLSAVAPMERHLRDLVDHFLYPADASDLLLDADLTDRWSYSRCGIGVDDLYRSINDQETDKAHYWRCLSSTPFAPSQITLFLGLVPEKRATWGLCSQQEWETIQRDPNLKDQVDDSRGHRPFTFMTKTEPKDSL